MPFTISARGTSGLGELGVAIANVAGGAELRADEKAQVADEVQRDVAGGVRQAFWELPHVGFVGICEKFVTQRDELAVDEPGNIRS